MVRQDPDLMSGNQTKVYADLPSLVGEVRIASSLAKAASYRGAIVHPTSFSRRGPSPARRGARRGGEIEVHAPALVAVLGVRAPALARGRGQHELGAELVQSGLHDAVAGGFGKRSRVVPSRWRQPLLDECEALRRRRRVGWRDNTPSLPRALAAEYGAERRISEERVDPAEVASIVAEAAAARNGWKVILARCAPTTKPRSALQRAREMIAARDLADRV